MRGAHRPCRRSPCGAPAGAAKAARGALRTGAGRLTAAAIAGGALAGAARPRPPVAARSVPGGLGGRLGSRLGGVGDRHRDLAAELERRHELEAVAAPEAPGVVPARRPLAREQAHVLVGRGDELGAVDRLQRLLRAPAHAARGPLAREPQRGREGAPVVALDDLHQPVLVLALDGPLELADPSALAVAVLPRRHGVGELVQLHPALVLAGPHVGQRAPQLRVPQQRRQVVERDDHADVVDGRVGDRADGEVGEGDAAEDPHVAGRRDADGLVQGHLRAGHGR